MAGGVKVIKSLVSIPIVLPRLAQNWALKQDACLRGCLLSPSCGTFLVNSSRLSVRFLRVCVRYVLLYLDATSDAL